jgi:HEAT repeat protein
VHETQNTPLHDILAKIQRKSDTIGLSEDDLNKLKDVVEENADAPQKVDSEPDGTSETTTLFRTMVRHFYSWDQELGLHMSFDNDGLSELFKEIDPGVHNRLSTVGYLTHPVRSEQVIEAVIASVRSGVNSYCFQNSLLMAGLMDIEDCSELIIDYLRSERSDSGNVRNALASLLIFEVNSVADIFKAHITYEYDSRIRDYCFIYFQRHPEEIEEKELIGYYEKEEDADVLSRRVDLLLRFIASGFDPEAVLTKIIDESYITADMAKTIAEVVWNYEKRELADLLWSWGEAGLARFLPLLAYEHSVRWALPVLKDWLANAQDISSDARAYLISTIGLMDDTCSQWLTVLMDDADWSIRTAAVMGALGKKDLMPRVYKMTTDADVDVRASAHIALSVQGQQEGRDEIVCQELWMSGLLERDMYIAYLPYKWYAKKNGLLPPPCVLDRITMFDQLGLDVCLDYYRDHLTDLLRWVPGVAESDNGDIDIFSEPPREIQAERRALAILGMLCDERSDIFLEHYMVDRANLQQKMSALLCANSRPRSAAGNFIRRIITIQNPKEVRVNKEDLLPAVLQIAIGDQSIYDKIVDAFGDDGVQLESIMGYLLRMRVSDSADEKIIKGLSHIEQLGDPMLQDVKRLMVMPSTDTGEFAFPERFLYNNFQGVRKRLAWRLRNGEFHTGTSSSFLLQLLQDEDSEVVVLALKSYFRVCPAKQDKYFALQYAMCHENWSVRQEAVELMRTTDGFVMDSWHTLVGLWIKEEDTDVLSSAIRLIKTKDAIETKSNDLLYTAMDPNLVNMQFNINLKWDSDQDYHTEAMRVVIEAITKRSRAEAAETYAGRNVVITNIPIPYEAPAAGKWLNKEEFDTIAVYLKVTLVDDDTGAIVTEVAGQKTGEIFNLLFEGKNSIAIRASWS